MGVLSKCWSSPNYLLSEFTECHILATFTNNILKTTAVGGSVYTTHRPHCLNRP